ncbi:MAG: hypothetical protein K0R65_1480 [Crocinitomicaceae bacterium]|jgi:hypothetical protein|nr:hypothetical protein [Crocinitomicaceae bacterium]
MRQLLILVFSVSIIQVYSQEKPALPLEGISYGAAREDFPQKMKDISNPQSWEETRFVLPENRTVFGKTSSQTELVFWNKRLYQVNLTLPVESWDDLSAELNRKYGQPSSVDTAAKSGNWMKGKETVSLYALSTGLVLSFSDDTQKEFHFSDLLHGVLFYIIITIVGLFVLNWLFAKLITSYCKRCKTFNMEWTSVSTGNYKDYDPSPLSASMHHDTTHAFKCKKCGHVRKDRYSGFFSWMRSKD